MPDIDPEQTDRVLELAKIPQGDRDAGWAVEFFNAIETAAFSIPPEEMRKGPDGFPYLLFHVPAKGAEFRGFSVKTVVDVCLEKGLGIAIFGEGGPDAPIWVFSYGNLWSYKTTGRFDARSGNEPAPTAVGGAERRVLIAAPSETLFPPYARARVREFLEANGLNSPKVAFVQDPATGPTPVLLFSIYSDVIDTDEHLRGIMYRLSWYVPPHVVISPMRQRGGEVDKLMVEF